MKKANASVEYRKLPSVDEVLNGEVGLSLLSEYPHRVVVEAVRAALDIARDTISGGATAPDEVKLKESIQENIREKTTASLRRAINATGVIVTRASGDQCFVAKLLML